ncbi:MAG: TIGR02147 family protein [Fibrobacter sp.]|nr:TIGR02147 family protein [Fibrobacter sp.]
MFARNKINIYDYLDYRLFLRDFYDLEKSLDPTFSYRVFATAVDIDASLLVKILRSKRHLSDTSVNTFVAFFNFKEGKSEYFQEMVAYGKAKTPDAIRKHFETLQKMRPSRCRMLDEARYRYFQQWYYPMVRSALDVYEYRGEQDAVSLGNSCIPKLTAAQIVTSVEALLQLGLAKRNEQGRIVPSDAHVRTQDHWLSASISEYQKTVTELGRQSIENIPKENRDISTLTMALDSSQIEKIRGILADARKSIVNVVNSMPAEQCDSVYQLNFQMFPMMKKVRS